MNRRYVVIVTPEAETGIVTAFQYILERSPSNAEKWLRALYKKIDSLEQMPERCPLARENEYFEDTLRHLVFNLIELSSGSTRPKGSFRSSTFVTQNSGPSENRPKTSNQLGRAF